MRAVRVSIAIAAAAAATTALAACGAPAARVTIERLEGGTREHVIARCVAHGGKRPVTYAWTLGTAVRAATPGAPLDEPALLVAVQDPARLAGGGGTVTCTVTDGVGRQASATAQLAPLIINKVVAAAGAPIVVEGSGFGVRGGGDALYVAGARGLVVADHACKQASWTDARIVACAPASVGAGIGAVREVRVESAGRLALAAPGFSRPAAPSPPAPPPVKALVTPPRIAPPARGRQ
jgi:hypothetical protein